METLLAVAQVLALLGVTALCVYLIVVLTNVRSVLGTLQKELSEVSVRLKPVLENLEVITARFKSVATTLDEHVSVTRGSLEAVKQMAENVLEFEQRMQRILEEPVQRISALLGAVIERVFSRFGRSSGD